jgi:hypothetical protein
MSAIDWVPGDMLGLQIPAHSEALRAGGESFLTDAFRSAGALAADNRVTRITQFEECPGGSTGRKLFLSVAYEKPAPGLFTALFVKFSRDFDDAIRDRAKIQMESEVRFALLSRTPGFPIAVPTCLFADYHKESGTGILITQRVAYATEGVERHYEKCLDYTMPAPLEHYQALIKSVARLAGTNCAGRLRDGSPNNPNDIAEQFPFDAGGLTVADRVPYTAKQLQNRVARYGEFAAKFPQLLPVNLTSSAFISQLSAEVARFPEHESAIKTFLHSKPEFIALCHWNANVDNAWFWRNARGEIECGLLDWGHVSQMNVAMALWGCLSGAETQFLDDHLDALLALFVAEFRRYGGPPVEVGELKFHLHLYIATMGLAWLMDAPALIQAQIPDLAAIDNRFDPRFSTNETARAQLQLMTTFLNLWRNQDFGRVLDRFISEQSDATAAPKR